MNVDVDVAVIGGGPVGTLLAAELRLAGAGAVVVLEQRSEPNPHSRAFRLQTRTLELLDQRGILKRFTDTAATWPKAHFAGIHPLLDLAMLPSSHPYALLIPQARTEALLNKRALELGAEIRRGHRVLGLTQSDDRVVLRIEGPEGEHDLSARYVIGCDGGHSVVRNLAGIDFPGSGGTVSALLGDVVLEDPSALPIGLPGTLRRPEGLLMAVTLEEGITRILTTEFGPRQQPAQSGEVTLDELKAAVRRVSGTDVELSNPQWLSRFTDSTRLAEHYRAGRVLLAGDAAHVHFPIGAQGLNLGLQDAMNLGWKLAAVVSGRAPESLLDSYESERRPAAAGVLRETRAQLALMNPDPSVDPLRELFADLLAIPEVNLHLSEMITGLDVRYPVPDGSHPLVGCRVPDFTLHGSGETHRVAELLHGGRGVLIDLGADSAAHRAAVPWADRVDLVAATATVGAPAEALLIRPDGCVAWVGGGAAATEDGIASLETALDTWFGAPVR
ncbi:FAD-dependent monooxygenase [Streptacidiphilus albus]|uniref:FAD-dependent monooxygenase n=1 Tax=Streptacidiphilus albus TaxID=105425 RepID=UPI00054BA367|nr:FAD-dependent monooxygenase [Streptacidiphilus albus]